MNTPRIFQVPAWISLAPLTHLLVRGLPLLAVLVLAGSVSVRAEPALIQPVETWRAGFNLSAPAYTTTIGRPLSPASRYTELLGADSYFAFPARGSEKIVSAAKVRLLDRSGSSPSPISLTLEVMAMDGTLLRTLSSQPLDLLTAPTHEWLVLPVVPDPALLVLQPGEYLAYHIQAGGPAGSIDVPLAFEVTIQQDLPIFLFFPVFYQ